MTDWRYSYLTMMPDYEASVLESFAEMLRRKPGRRGANEELIFRGSRAVFWSVN